MPAFSRYPSIHWRSAQFERLPDQNTGSDKRRPVLGCGRCESFYPSLYRNPVRKAG